MNNQNLSSEPGHVTPDQLNSVRAQLLSSLPSDVWRGIGQVRQWLQQEPENHYIYEFLLDVVHDAPVLRDEVRSLLEEMKNEGSKFSAEALDRFPIAIQDLMAEADDAYYAGEYSHAIELYRDVLFREPNHQRAQTQLEKALLNRSAEQRNKDIPRQALQYFQQARSYISAGEINTAIKLLNAALEEARASEKKFPDAEKLLDELRDVLVANEFKEKANLAIREGRWEDALTLYNRAIPLDSSNEMIKEMCSILQNLLEGEKSVNSLHNVRDIKERRVKLEKIALSLNVAEDFKNLVSSLRYKKMSARANLYRAEVDLWKWRVFRGWAPQSKVRRAQSDAKNILDPHDPASKYVEAQLKTLVPFRRWSLIVAVILFVLFVAIGAKDEIQQFLSSLTGTQAVVSATTSVSPIVVTPSLTPTATTTTTSSVTPTFLATATLTLPPPNTPTPLPTGYITKAYVTTFDSPNGKQSGTIQGINVPVTILQERTVGVDLWYFCAWEINGNVKQGWIRAEYIQLGQTPTP
jgi:tetratricopeptide (TPR) repeat protein